MIHKIRLAPIRRIYPERYILLLICFLSVLAYKGYSDNLSLFSSDTGLYDVIY